MCASKLMKSRLSCLHSGISGAFVKSEKRPSNWRRKLRVPLLQMWFGAEAMLVSQEPEASTTEPDGLLLPAKALPMKPVIWSRTNPASLGLGAVRCERHDALKYTSPARWQRTLCNVFKRTSVLRRPTFSVRRSFLARKGARCLPNRLLSFTLMAFPAS